MLQLTQLQEFYIELEKKDSTFFPGDTVVGHIFVKAKQIIEIDQITVLFYGSAKPKGRVRTV
jgi:hypothetical protein